MQTPKEKGDTHMASSDSRRRFPCSVPGMPARAASGSDERRGLRNSIGPRPLPKKIGPQLAASSFYCWWR